MPPIEILRGKERSRRSGGYISDIVVAVGVKSRRHLRDASRGNASGAVEPLDRRKLHCVEQSPMIVISRRATYGPASLSSIEGWPMTSLLPARDISNTWLGSPALPGTEIASF